MCLFSRVVISRDPHFKETELTLNVSDTKLELPQDKLEAGRVYFVGVSLVDSEGYASPLTWVGPHIAPVPQEDIVVTPTGAAGVLVPIFIVIAVLGSALGYYMYRNRRLARNFAAYASRYNAASGTTILNTVSLYIFYTLLQIISKKPGNLVFKGFKKIATFFMFLRTVKRI